MLKIKNAYKCYNKRRKNKIVAVNNTSLKLDDTGLVALLGPSGCGKTTLLNMIGGLDKLDKGKIYIDREYISSKLTSKVDKIRNIRIGYIFQDYKLIENLSVYDNVSLVLRMQGIKDRNEIKEKVEYVLDCVGMLRYKKRPVSMLSGGERQRVGIARALVKDPDIILADEPTGNLDSKNSLEIMKIIKSISEKRLVLLVTHEQNLARFYADRIIEIQDGTVIKDYYNDEINDLDYELDNCFYLKDYKDKSKIDSDNVNINLYRNNKEKIKLDIVVKNNNIYIKSKNSSKIEVVDEESNIEFINDSYKKINNKNKYEFDFKKLETDSKKRYASIINIFTMIRDGFKKVIEYPILKKILLVGFFLAGMFIMYSVSSYMASTRIKEEEFVSANKSYLRVDNSSNNISNYLNIEKNPDVRYIMPGSSIVSVRVLTNDYFQTSKANISLDVSLSDIDEINKEDLLYGRLPNNNKEIVIDDLAFTKKSGNDASYQMVGLFSSKDLINKYVSIGDREYLVVGISSLTSPCMYIDRDEFMGILSRDLNDMSNINNKDTNIKLDIIKDYNEYKDNLELKKGRIPSNDYEVMVNISNEYNMPLNKEIDYKIDNHKLKVVGYYYNKDIDNNIYSNSNTIKYLVILNKKSYIIMPVDKNKLLNSNIGNIKDIYKVDRDKYVKERKEDNKNTIVISLIILSISFIEIFLMIRASFLSRIKEVGIYRAIGVKRLDICRMFMGEIIAITSTASMLGLLFMAYMLRVLSEIKSLKSYIMIDTSTLFIAIVLVYVFNIIVGLLPVINSIRKRPSEILSRYDLD